MVIMSHTPDARSAAIAEMQMGCLARAQALEVGVTDRMIARRLATGRWRRVHPGVYLVNGVPRSWTQDVWAAKLAAGPDAVVTHDTALLLHGLPDDRLPRYPVALTVPHGQHHRIVGAVIHQIDDLRPRHLDEVGGLPVSKPCRAVVEIAATAGRGHLGSVVDDLVAARQTTIAEISGCFAELARPGKRGVAKLAQVLDARGPGYVPPQSKLEAQLLAALAVGGLPPPTRQIPLPGRGPMEGVVDAAYREAQLLLEADGRRWHTRVRDLRRDHERDAQASRAGWLTLRFVYETLMAASGEVAATVAEVRRVRLGQLGRMAS